MPALIKDEFSYFNMTRQQRYMLRKKRDGLCVICGKKRDGGNRSHCAKHAEMARRMVKDGLKYKANSLVNRMIQSGRLIRGSCVVCGKSGEAHHKDYAKPLEITWLCSKHHCLEHKQTPRKPDCLRKWSDVRKDGCLTLGPKEHRVYQLNARKNRIRIKQLTKEEKEDIIKMNSDCMSSSMYQYRRNILISLGLPTKTTANRFQTKSFTGPLTKNAFTPGDVSSS